MLSSEITEEQDEENPYFINSEAQKQSIRRIIQHQKSMYWSSTSSITSAAASSSSVSSSRRSGSSLLSLMKSGSTSLKRLFEMEHTSLSSHFHDYSGSPIIKSIPLWGSDTDGEQQHHDPWESIKSIGSFDNFETGSLSRFDSDDGSMEKDFRINTRNIRNSSSKHRLTRKKSYKKLPGFRFKLRLKRLRIMICGRLF